MSKKTETTEIPQDALERIFHSPIRMAILSNLCSAGKGGLTFTELKQACDLTDGNLNGHLAALIADNVVKVTKEFIGLKPRSTIFLTKTGLDRFSEYLDALHVALKTAKAALPSANKKVSAAPSGVRARA